MKRSITKSAADKLGDRIRKQGLSEEDLRLLQRFRLDYDAALAEVERVLRDQLGLDPTSRTKSVNTIVEKLGREKTRLSSMQDVVGVRVVREMTLDEQDSLVTQICERFDENRVDDRRATPTHGYRAVHVIVTISGFPVEIQVRTERQHLWAEFFEKLADRWGRQIRYGEPPDAPDAPVGELTRRDFVEALKSASEVFYVFETPLHILEARLKEVQAEGAFEEEGKPGIEFGELKDKIEKDDAELRLMFKRALKDLEDE